MFRGRDMALLFINADDIPRYQERKGVVFVDLRKKEEYEAGHIRGAIHIPYDMLEERVEELKEYSMIILYCRRGNQSLRGARQLGDLGYRVATLGGGYEGQLTK